MTYSEEHQEYFNKDAYSISRKREAARYRDEDEWADGCIEEYEIWHEHVNRIYEKRKSVSPDKEET